MSQSSNEVLKSTIQKLNTVHLPLTLLNTLVSIRFLVSTIYYSEVKSSDLCSTEMGFFLFVFLRYLLILSQRFYHTFSASQTEEDRIMITFEPEPC